MIHELRTYTTPIGKAPELAKLSAQLGRSIRGDEYGTLEGYWLGEVGSLNQVHHLWSYGDLNHRADRRAALAQNADWRDKYLPVAGPLIIRQDIRLLNPMKPLSAVQGEGHIYEYRYYRAKPGRSKPFAQALLDALPAREKYSKNVGLWITEAGQPNEVSHLWVYDSFEARLAARAATMEDPEWKEFLKNGPNMLDEMSSMIFVPAAHSPRK
jgi:hypothetical protein